MKGRSCSFPYRYQLLNHLLFVVGTLFLRLFEILILYPSSLVVSLLYFPLEISVSSTTFLMSLIVESAKDSDFALTI